MEAALKNHALWVGLSCTGMPFSTELEMLNVVRGQVETITGNHLAVSDFLSVQRIMTSEPLYIFYCKDPAVKTKLMSCVSVEVGGREYQLIDMATTSGFGNKGSRISIHGIPFSVTDSEIESWVDEWATRSSKVMKAKAKPKQNQDHNLLNGNRFCYASRINEHLPRYSVYSIPDPLQPTSLVDIQITVYYDNQPINCRKCLEDHETKDCNSGGYNANLEIFRGEKNPLSNFYPVDLHSHNLTFPTAEHLYQYNKATKLDTPREAEAILAASRPIEAMRIGNSIKANNVEEWEDSKLQNMRAILEAKFQACPDFRDKLMDTQDKFLVEATNNLYWASGLPPRATANQPIDSWPGRNQLGKLLMELRAVRRSRGQTPQAAATDDADREAIELADALLCKALHPADSSISSPELIQRADDVIRAGSSEHLEPNVIVVTSSEPAEYDLSEQSTSTATTPKPPRNINRSGKHSFRDRSSKRKNISPLTSGNVSPPQEKPTSKRFKDFFMRSKHSMISDKT